MSSQASVTIRSTSTWARSSTCSGCARSTSSTTFRSRRTPASTAWAASTRTRSRSRSRSRSSTGPDGQSTIGVYAAASRRETAVLDARGGKLRGKGDWVQISRLAEPLINEVIIPLKDKDKWNFSKPRDDQQFARVLPGSRGHSARERALRRRSTTPTRRGATISSRSCSPASRLQLHREHEGRPDPAQHGHRAFGPGLPGQPARRARGRSRRLPERPPPRGRRRRHRGPGVDGGVRRVPRRELRAPEPKPEQPARGRRRHERPVVPRRTSRTWALRIRATSTYTTARSAAGNAERDCTKDDPGSGSGDSR